MLYLGLFLTALLAATIFPAQSEAAVAGMLLSGHRPLLVIGIASVGNVLGSVVNWWLGTQAAKFGHRRWFPLKPAQIERASGWYRRYGRWSLLLSWVPVVGDPLTLAAGFLRERLLVFLLLVSIAKTGRYVVLTLLVLESL
jgi:membrane protein YqaA with SNARE-associated domain